MIVVTGAAGIIGRAVVSDLASSGYRVQPVVRVAAGDGKAIACDLSQCDSREEVIKAPVEGIIHLAAAVPHSTRYPDSADSAGLTRNMDACIHRAARAWGCPVVYASSCGFYDRANLAEKIEDDDSFINSNGPYFDAKFAGEALLLSLPEARVLRISAPLGAGVSRNLVASRYISAAMNDAELSVWGTGSREQSFVDVRDIAVAIRLALQASGAGVFNIAASAPVTMRGLAEEIVRTIGRGTVVMSGRPDPLDGETARYSIAKAEEVLGWKPQRSLADAIWETAESFDNEPA